MSVTDIIPDIHGQAEKLRVGLRNLGWRRTGTNWSHHERDRQIVFLGDFIDRGPENGAVIRIVRELMDAGKARAIMGNHELNALHFHTLDPETGRPLRAHDDQKNLNQHASFLKEFPVGAPETREVLNWMRSLPLFIEEEDFRAVHAAWIDAAINELRVHTGNGVLSEEQLLRAARSGDVMFDLAETITKGPEYRLPDNYWFKDKGGHVRHAIRLKWWKGNAKTWREIAISVPEVEQLPDEALPPSLITSIYPAHERPVFFGHYWMSDQLKIQAPNAVCLDYSAGTDGPLVTYAMEKGATSIGRSNMSEHWLAHGS